MTGIVFFDLIPLTLKLADPFLSILSTAVGVIMVGLFSLSQQKIKEQSLETTGWILLFTMALHNFPEGLAIGSAGAENEKIGLIVALTIAIHDIPEGMAVATPFVEGKFKNNSIFLITMLSGLSTVIGGMVGFWLGNISAQANAFCLGVAGGAMLYVVFVELLPTAIKTNTKLTTFWYFLIGTSIGLFFLLL